MPEPEDKVPAKPKTFSGKLLKFGVRSKNVLGTSLNYKVHDAVDRDERVGAIHSRAEVFDENTEEYFKFIQIVTAVCGSFAHGANDVANAMAPFMSCYFIYNFGAPTGKKVDTGNDGIWILAMGGAFISLGLILYGYRIIEALGVKLIKITPARGYCIELGAFTVIIAGSFVGMPLSTTHCQVGATYGVGMWESRQKCGFNWIFHNEGVNNWLLLKTVLGWILTVVLVALSSAFLVSWGIWAPLSLPLEGALLETKCPAWAIQHNFTNLTAIPYIKDVYPFPGTRWGPLLIDGQPIGPVNSGTF
jgi:sodium-dependent phosphate transporter